MGGPAIAVIGLVKRRDGFVLSVDDLAVRVGEVCALVGPSGAGKTTLLHLMGGFLSPDSGDIWVLGRSPKTHRGDQRAIRTVFHDLVLFPHLTARGQLLLGLARSSESRRAKKRRADEWLERLELDEQRTARTHTLSKGQLQRLALGRAMISEPPVLLLDEPMSSLDPGLRDDLWRSLLDERKDGTTVVVVTHDPDGALAYADHVAVLMRGTLAQSGCTSEVYRRPASVAVGELFGPINEIDWEGRTVLARPEALSLQAAAGYAEVGRGTVREQVQRSGYCEVQFQAEGRLDPVVVHVPETLTSEESGRRTRLYCRLDTLRN